MRTLLDSFRQGKISTMVMGNYFRVLEKRTQATTISDAYNVMEENLALDIIAIFSFSRHVCIF